MYQYKCSASIKTIIHQVHIQSTSILQRYSKQHVLYISNNGMKRIQTFLTINNDPPIKIIFPFTLNI